MGRRHAYAETPLGALLLVADDGEADDGVEIEAGFEDGVEDGVDEGAEADPGSRDALCGIYFPGHWYPPEPESIGDRVEVDGDPLFRAVASQLAEYLAGERREFDLPVRTHGDDISERVWAMLREIPYGATTTYGAIAIALGNRNLAQRVGQCVGRNPVSIVIPCHRVVGADGSLTGFAGGLERKRHLLELEEPEEVSASRLF